MIGILTRNAIDSSDVERRRIALAVTISLSISGVWYLVRPALSLWVARNSIGCSARHTMIARTLLERFPDVPIEIQTRWSHHFRGPLTDVNIDSYSYPRPGWVCCKHDQYTPASKSGFQLPDSTHFYFFDHWLNQQGVVTMSHIRDTWSQTTPVVALDADGDGCWEIVLECLFLASETGEEGPYYQWVVLRLSQDRNEILWAGLIESAKWRAGVRLGPVWEEGPNVDGKRLAFITQERVRLPSGSYSWKPPRTIAVFDWTDRGGTLKPVVFSENDGIIPWNHPSTTPTYLAPDEDLAAKLAELLPLPREHMP